MSSAVGGVAAGDGATIRAMTSTLPALGTGPALGTLRRLSRMADRSGFLRVAAIDHPENYLALFDPDVSTVSFAEVVESKLELVRAMADHASALLLDPVWSLGQGILTGAVPPGVGIISAIEQLSYQPEGSPTGWGAELALKPDWPVGKISAIGADGVKLVVFHRSGSPAAEAQYAVVANLVAQCRNHELPLIVEPIWYPLPGENPADPSVVAGRIRAVIDSAARFAELGVDIMKMEFPGSVATEDDRAAAADACAELDDGIDVPWVLLSAGVGFDDFAEQVRIAAAAGASGFMAGRAIWGDAVGRVDEAARRAGAKTACERLDVLGEIVSAAGRPVRTPLTVAQTLEVLGPDWHTEYRA
jgi:tagatose-1,6-bisphosphate aldolase